jgi:hypothetical protein
MKNNIEMDLTYIGCDDVEWIEAAQVRILWQGFFVLL